MFREMLKSKIHRASVVEANLNYVGSITIDEDLMQKGDILVNEKVLVVDINNGARFETYAIPGKKGSGMICLNGAAARLVHVGDKVIIITFAQYSEEDLKNYKPTVVFVGDNNEIKEVVK